MSSTTITIRVPEVLKDKLQDSAQKKGLAPSSYIKCVLEELEYTAENDQLSYSQNELDAYAKKLQETADIKLNELQQEMAVHKAEYRHKLNECAASQRTRKPF